MNLLRYRRQHIEETRHVDRELTKLEHLTAEMAARLLRLEAEIELYTRRKGA